MKKKQMLSAVLIGLMLVGGATLALAKPWGGGRCGEGGGMMSAEQRQERHEQRLEMMATLLDLSAEQQAEIKALLENQAQDHDAMREQMRQSRDELHAAMTGEQFDEAQFRAQAGKKAEQMTEMLVAKAKMKQQIFAILTPEQQAKAEKLLEMDGRGRHGMKF